MLQLFRMTEIRPHTIVWRNGVCAMPELQNMPQVQIPCGIALRDRPPAVSMARPSSRNVHSAAPINMCAEYPLDKASRRGAAAHHKCGSRSCIAIVRCDPFIWRKHLVRMHRFCRPELERAARSFLIQPPRPRTEGRPDRNSLLRRLPFRPSSGTRRMA
jgi:hypothetical protein